MGRAGLELRPLSTGKSAHAGYGGNDSGNNWTNLDRVAKDGDRLASGPCDPDLSQVIAAWPMLPPALRAGIVAMVRGIGEPPAR